MLDTEKKLFEQLKEIMPFLINAKDFIDKSKPEVEGIKDLKAQIDAFGGNLTDMQSKVVELGKRKIHVQPSGMNAEQKMDFAKFFVHAYKMQKSGMANETSRQIVTDLQEKYGQKSLTEGTDADGGYTVPLEFRDMIWYAAKQASVILSKAMVSPITVGYKMPTLSLASDVSVSWEDEAAALDESNPTFGKSTVNAKKIAAYSKMSNELLEDEEIGLTDFLVTLFSAAIGEEIDNQGFNGTGTPFTGILKNGSVNTVTMASGDGAFADITFQYLSDMISQIKASVRTGAEFFLHRTIINYLRKVRSTANDYIWFPPANGQPGTIWGYPYNEVEKMPASTASAVSTQFVMFGNLKYYQVGTRGNMTFRVSDIPHLLNDQTILVVRRRIALGMGLAEAFSVLKTNAVDS